MLGVNQARACLVGQAEFQTLEGTVLTGSTVGVGAAVAGVPSQKGTAEEERDRARVRARCPPWAAPGGGPEPLPREPRAGRDRWSSVEKAEQPGLGGRGGAPTLSAPSDRPEPYAASLLIFPSGPIGNILPIFCKIIFLTKISANQMVCPQPLPV